MLNGFCTWLSRFPLYIRHKTKIRHSYVQRKNQACFSEIKKRVSPRYHNKNSSKCDRLLKEQKSGQKKNKEIQKSPSGTIWSDIIRQLVEREALAKLVFVPVRRVLIELDMLSRKWWFICAVLSVSVSIKFKCF